MRIDIIGLKEVRARMRQARRDTAAGIARGLKQAGLWLQRESMAIVPIQFGFLRASAFTRAFGTGVDTYVIVGYTAKYAVYVHEDLEAAHGKAFNMKYAEEIAATEAGLTRSRDSRGRFVSQAANPYFRRGERQRAKYLEEPARYGRGHMQQIVMRSAAL